MADTIDAAAMKRGFLEDLAKQIGDRARKAVPKWQRKLRALIAQSIVDSPEYDSLHGGRLQAELGPVRPDVTINAIIAGIQRGLLIDVSPITVSGNDLSGYIEIMFFKKDLSEVLGTPGSSFTSEGGSFIDWLKWLLTRGDEIIIKTFHFKPGRNPHGISRTGLGYMRGGYTWHVPSEFAGYENDNWLTKTLDSHSIYIVDMILEDL